MNKLKRILLIVVIFLLTIILCQSTSKGARIDFGTISGVLSLHEQSWEIDNWDLKLGLDNVFCVQHNQRAREGSKWTVQNYIRIEGRHSTFYRDNYYDDEHKLAEHENDENLIMAWILNQPFEASDFSNYGESTRHYSDMQKAVYLI